LSGKGSRAADIESAARIIQKEPIMWRYCWGVVLAGVFSLGLFGCALSSDIAPDDDDDSESGEPAVSESIVESEPDATCPLWLCDSVHPSGCVGFGYGSSIGRCVVEARNNCNANCGPGCPLDDSPTCESF
jgi:hypothetical protein